MAEERTQKKVASIFRPEEHFFNFLFFGGFFFMRAACKTPWLQPYIILDVNVEARSQCVSALFFSRRAYSPEGRGVYRLRS